MPTVDPADIRGLVTTLLFTVKRLPHSRHEGRPKPPLNALEGCAKPGPCLCPISGTVSTVDRRLPGDGPHEGDELLLHSAKPFDLLVPRARIPGRQSAVAPWGT